MRALGKSLNLDLFLATASAVGEQLAMPTKQSVYLFQGQEEHLHICVSVSQEMTKNQGRMVFCK